MSKVQIRKIDGQWTDMSKEEMKKVRGGLVAFNFAIGQPEEDKVSPLGQGKTPGGEKI